MKLVPLGAVTRTVAPRPFSMTAMAARNLCRLDLDRPLIHRLNERHVRRIGRQKPMEVDGTHPRCLDQVLERLVVHRSQVGRQPDGRLRALPAGLTTGGLPVALEFDGPSGADRKMRPRSRACRPLRLPRDHMTQ